MGNKLKPETKLNVFNKYKGKCAYCGVEININKMHIDHIEPKYRGWNNEELIKYNKVKGKDSIDNFNPSCISCNCSKSTYSIEEWRNQLKHKIICLRRDVSNFRILERFGLISVNKIEIEFYFEKESEVKNG